MRWANVPIVMRVSGCGGLLRNIFGHDRMPAFMLWLSTQDLLKIKPGNILAWMGEEFTRLHPYTQELLELYN